jgi:6-pyruvoyltetrahydropterin/6-carboxytetrahydropterin synthase
MYLVRVEVTFDSGHRLLDYEGKCAFPHGHTYRAEIFLSADSLDPLGLVFDFTELKRRIKDWIDAHWDHAFLVNSRDTELIAGLSRLTKNRLYTFQQENPSCEVMARELYNKVRELCEVAPAKVRLWESFNQYSEFCNVGAQSITPTKGVEHD